jgi:glycine oxidase
MSGPLDNKRNATDVVIAGGGVIGMSIAWRAAQAGLRVVVAERSEAGAGATHVAAGMLAPVTEADFGEQDMIALNLAAAEQFASFAEELEAVSGCPTGYRRTGTLSVAVDRDQAEALERMHRFRLSLGLEGEQLSARECRRLEPALAPRVLGGVVAPGDHSVDPRALLSALGVAAARAGAELLEGEGAAVEELLIAGGRAAGARLADGRELMAGQVVIAAGAASAAIEGLPVDAGVRVRPVKGQILRLRATATAPQPLARVLRTEDVYAVPRADGILVVGATMEERGFDTTVTAGAVLDLLRYAYDVVPGIAELELIELEAGLRPTAPDNRPIVGAGAVEGSVWATGHWRNGVLLAPVTADAVVSVLAGRALPPLLEPFSPARFERSPEPAGSLRA